MNKLKLFGLSWLLILVACSGLGLQPAQSFDERAAYAEASAIAVIETTTRALQFGDITADEAQNVADIADNAKTLIDTAQTIASAGDAAGADKTLAMAIKVLQELQVFLRSKQR